MKRIRIYGCKNKRFKEKLRKAALFYRESLLPRKRKLDIVICLIPNLVEEFGAFGECWEGDTPNNFRITLDGKVSQKSILQTLAHEFVHVKQFAKGELKYLQKGDKWCGSVYSSKTPYSKQPWEKEAKKLETKLYSEWMFSRKG